MCRDARKVDGGFPLAIGHASSKTGVMDITDRTACYRAVQSRDRRFDGVFYTAVRTTGIYCRPSCSAVTPKLRNVSFHPTAAAAQLAGFGPVGAAVRMRLPAHRSGMWSPTWPAALCG